MRCSAFWSLSHSGISQMAGRKEHEALIFLISLYGDGLNEMIHGSQPGSECRQRWGVRKNSKFHYRNFVARMRIYLMRQLKSRFLYLILKLLYPVHIRMAFKAFWKWWQIKVTPCCYFTGLYSNTWTAPKSQTAGFVSEEILALSHCNLLLYNNPITELILIILTSS